LNFQDIMFVDVGCQLQNGELCLNRTMAINRAAPLRRIGVDVTAMLIMLYGLNDSIQLVWMVSQAGRLTRAARNLPFSLRLGRRRWRRPRRREGCSWPAALADQPDSPTHEAVGVRSVCQSGAVQLSIRTESGMSIRCRMFHRF
jgi:hypothetical protein